MLDGQTATFIAVAAFVTVVPGMDTMLVVRNVLRGGRRDGVLTTIGINSGLFVHALLSALGVSILLMHSASAFQAVKLVGAGYLVWLGIQSIRGSVQGGKAMTAVELGSSMSRTVSRSRCLVEGFLSNVLNPKVAIFYLAFLPQFISPSDPVVLRSLLLACIHCVEGILWLSIVAIMVDKARQWFQNVTLRRWLDGICGTLFVGIGARLVFAEQ